MKDMTFGKTKSIKSVSNTNGSVLYDQTKDLKLVSQQLRHSDVETTVRPNDKKFMEAVQNVVITY